MTIGIDPRAALGNIRQGLTEGAGAVKDKVQDAASATVSATQERVGAGVDRLQSAVQSGVDGVQNRVQSGVDGVQAAVQTQAGQLADGFGENVLDPGRGILGQLGDVFFPSPVNKEHDGHLVGANGESFAPGTPLSEIPAVEPVRMLPGAPTPEADKTFLYVNGINTPKDMHEATLQGFANQTGGRVVGLYNATEGFIQDLAQSAGDTADLGNNAAVSSLADVVYTELQAGREVNLLAHSQGTIVTSRALSDVKERLMSEGGLSESDAEALMSNAKVETYASAVGQFPDGPEYVHYVNTRDIVPMALGLGKELTDSSNLVNPGEGAVLHRFAEGNPLNVIDAHSIDDTYIPRRVPFEAARAGQFAAA